MSKTTDEMIKILRKAMLDMDNADNTETVIAANQYCTGYAQSTYDGGKITADQFRELLREIASHYEAGRAKFPEWTPARFD